MNITMKEFISIGFEPPVASRIMNEICRLVPYQTISRFEEVTRKGIKTTQYQILRAVAIEDVLKVCEHKIDHPRAKTSIDKWKQIKHSIEDFLK
ncbi:MAG: hypothetical protein IE884_00470 [Sulfuricurvum sp.]|nr:hypothetical protein [Sulfuricurvum sp.]